MITVRKFLKERGGYLFALALVGSVLYAFNLHNVLFWDDADWILNNPAVHALTWSNITFIFSHDVLAGIGLVSNYYRPFLFLTFLVNYIVSQSSPVSYHLVSNAIHIANGLLVFYLLCRWLKRPRAAFLAALFFLIQPLQTEAVAYVSGRGDPLSVFFVLLGVACFVVLRGQGRPIAAYVWGALMMILAVLSRETAVLFPVYLGICLIAFELQGKLFSRVKQALYAVAPFIGLSVLYGVLRLTVLNFQNTLNFYQQQNIYSEHVLYRMYTFLHALLVYIRLAFVPIGLHMERDIPVSLSLGSGYTWLGAIAIVAGFSWLVYAYRHRSGETFYVWFFGLGIFFVNLGPTSGVVPINARMYEHWLYFSLLGLFAVVGWYLDRLLLWIEKHKPNLKPVLIIALVVYSLFLSVQTIRRNLIWGDTEAFYQNILSYESGNVRVLNNLGNWYSDEGRNDFAAPLYQRAIEADPTQPAPYYNLGNIARDQGDLAAAEKFYRQSIAVSPGFHYAYQNLAALYYAKHNLPKTIEVLENLEKVMPSPELAATIQKLKHLPSAP